jgi:WD40 repeat protein
LLLPNSEAHDGFIISMNVHKRRIMTGGKNGKVIVWNADTCTAELSISVPEHYIPGLNHHGTLNVALGSNYIAYGLYDGTFCVHDLATQRLLHELREPNIDQHGLWYAPMTLSMDSHYLLTNGAFPDELSVWSLKEGVRLYPLSESYAGEARL